MQHKIWSTLYRDIQQHIKCGASLTNLCEYKDTAEEIRFQAQELETSLGGQYSRLAEDFQLPMSYILLKDIDFSVQGKQIEPIIITGLESLSRNSEVDKLNLFLADMAAVANLPELVQRYLKVPEIMAIFGNARAVDYQEFTKSEDEVQQELQAEQQQILEAQNIAGQNEAINKAQGAQLAKS